jgi:hypothetical protein
MDPSPTPGYSNRSFLMQFPTLLLAPLSTLMALEDISTMVPKPLRRTKHPIFMDIALSHLNAPVVLK